MRKHVDTMIVVPNERLMAVVGKGVTFQDALKKADEVLLNATRGISEVITRPGLVNVDYADVRTVMQNGGSALMGTGTGKGEARAMEAAQQAISSPLLDNISINGATGVLLNMTGGDDLTLGEVHQISEIVHDAVGEEAELIFGAVLEPSMTGEIRVTVIATGFDKVVAVQPGVIQFPQRQSGAPRTTVGMQRSVTAQLQQQAAAGGGAGGAQQPLGQRRPSQPQAQQPGAGSQGSGAEPLPDMEIPTFIRRQMD
jgi:cell division protein FtsZ